MNNSEEKKIIETNSNNKDGQNKCPKCGATDISLNVSSGMLRCNFCRHEFSPEKVEGLEKDISKLEGEVITSGSKKKKKGKEKDNYIMIKWMIWINLIEEKRLMF